MADFNTIESANKNVDDMTDVQTEPEKNGKCEEIRLEVPAGNATLNIENDMLSDLTDFKDHAQRRASKSSRRKFSIRSQEPLGGQPFADVYYDDTDWVTDEEEEDEEDKKRSRNCLFLFVDGIQRGVRYCYQLMNTLTKGHLALIIFLLAFACYFTAALIYEFGDAQSIRLLTCTIAGILIFTRGTIYRLYKKIFIKLNGGKELSPKAKYCTDKIRLIIRWFMYAALAAAMVYVIIDQGRKSITNLRSLPGLVAFLLVCLIFSRAPGNINWHTIYWSVGLQFLGALFVLRWDKGKETILWIQNRLDEFFANSQEGSKFLFGENYAEHYFIFGALPIIFFSNAALVALYYVGAMQFVIKVIGSFLSFVVEGSPIESVAVTAGIFMEGVISMLTLKPYLGSLTRSQLFLVVTSIFSSLGGAYLAMLASFGVSLSHIIPAMLVSAPATFSVCKLMMPERRKKKGKEEKYDWNRAMLLQKEKYTNIMDAIQDGAMSMLPLIGNIIAVAFVFMSLISWINKTFVWFGDRVGIDDLTIELIFSYVLFPVSLAMGIEWDDCRRVAMLLGYRIGSNNIVAFLKLTQWKAQKAVYHKYMMATNYTGPISTWRDDITLDLWNTTLKHGFVSDRSEVIITYCLCGFSSILSMSVIMGIMYTLLPRRRAWLGQVAIPALIAGNIANCMSGCFASLFY